MSVRLSKATWANITAARYRRTLFGQFRPQLLTTSVSEVINRNTAYLAKRRTKGKEERVNQEQQLGRRRLVSWLLFGATIFVCIQLIIVTYIFNGLGLREVTIWEWFGVLIIPLALLAIGVWITNTQARRAETAATQRAQDEALQAYLSEMSNLVIQHKLRDEPEDSDIRKIAQARTIAVLLELDADRKRRSLKLVYELGLINKNALQNPAPVVSGEREADGTRQWLLSFGVTLVRPKRPSRRFEIRSKDEGLIKKDQPIIDLTNASLDKADFRELALPNSCLSHVDLRHTDLSGSNLSGSELSEADLRGANLTNADLSDVDLSDANLLPYDEKQPAKLSIHNLKDMNAGSNNAASQSTKLRRKLTPTNLTNTNLKGANLRGAILANTDLRRTRGLSKEQLEQAIGNQETRLPTGLESPVAWKKPIEKQIEMIYSRTKRRKSIA